MKRSLSSLLLAVLTIVQAWAQAPDQTTTKPKPTETLSSLDLPDPEKDKEILPSGMMKFAEVELSQVLGIYEELSGRSVIRAASIPPVKITFTNRTPLNRREALQALDTVLAQVGIATIPLGSKYIKVVPAAQAPMEAAPLIDRPRSQLPESGTYLVYIVHLKEGVAPNDLVPILTPFSKLPNSIMTIPDAGIILLRDYSANIRVMLQLLDRLGATADK